jgi:hypothetical protein
VEVAGGMKKNLYPLVGAAMIGCGPVLSNIHVKLVSFIDKLDVVRLLRVLIIWLWYRDYIKL